MGADANAGGTACEQTIEKADEETSKMQDVFFESAEIGGFSEQDLRELWSEKYEFAMSQLEMTDEQARRLADRALRAIQQTELEFRNG